MVLVKNAISLGLEFVDFAFQVIKQGSKLMFVGIKVCGLGEP